jgi:hypothetical protein
MKVSTENWLIRWGALLAYGSLALFACSGGWQPPPDEPEPGTACEAMCNHGTKLGCVWAEPTPEGTSCVTVCQDNERGWTSMHPECVLRATTCKEADRLSAYGCG